MCHKAKIKTKQIQLLVTTYRPKYYFFSLYTFKCYFSIYSYFKILVTVHLMPIPHFSSAKYFGFKNTIELQNKTQSCIDKTNAFKTKIGENERIRKVMPDKSC